MAVRVASRVSLRRADLVGLDEGGVDEPLLGASANRGILGRDQVVADDQDLLVEGLHELLPSLVVVLGEGVFQRDDRIFLHPANVQIDHFIGGQDLRIFGPPEQVLADRALFACLFAVGIAEFAGGGIEGEANIAVGNKAAFLDGLHGHPQCPLFGEQVALLFGVGGHDASLQADAHEVEPFRVLDDLDRPALQKIGDSLRLDVILGGERQEHQLLEAQVPAHFLGVTPAHDGVPELPGGEHNPSVGEFQLLEPVQPQLAPQLGRFDGAPFLHGVGRLRGPDLRRLGRRLLLSCSGTPCTFPRPTAGNRREQPRQS